jgi:transposase InsO family protein
MRYDFEINYVSEKLMGGPDALSRAPLQLKKCDESSARNPVAPDGDFNDLFISEIQRTNLSDPLIEQIQKKAKADGEYQAFVQAVRQGFPQGLKTESGEYWSMREGVYESEGLLFRNRELIAPRSSRLSVIRALHRAHQGLCSMLRRAEDNVCWPNMRKDLQQFRDECLHCQSHAPQQQRQTMMSVDVPTAPGLVIASDYFQAEGKEYVLFVDLFSSWTEYFKVASRRPGTLIKKLRHFMTRNGVPRVMYSDKGSAYDSHEFRSFCKEWGIELITCSGEYPQGNGTAESAVKRVKKWLAGATNEDELSKAILAWHQTPIVEGRPTPAQIHLGRNVRDEISTKIEPCPIPWGDVRLWRTAQKQSNATVYNKRARNLPDLDPGDRVFVSIHGKWRQAVVEDKAQRPRSFVVKMSDTGARLERNRVHLRLDKTRTVPVNSYAYFSADQK